MLGGAPDRRCQICFVIKYRPQQHRAAQTREASLPAPGKCVTAAQQPARLNIWVVSQIKVQPLNPPPLSSPSPQPAAIFDLCVLTSARLLLSALSQAEDKNLFMSFVYHRVSAMPRGLGRTAVNPA